MFKRILKCLKVILITIPLIIIVINLIIIFTTKNKILPIEETKKLTNIDCILILGAGIRGNNVRRSSISRNIFI